MIKIEMLLCFNSWYLLIAGYQLSEVANVSKYFYINMLQLNKQHSY